MTEKVKAVITKLGWLVRPSICNELLVPPGRTGQGWGGARVWGAGLRPGMARRTAQLVERHCRRANKRSPTSAHTDIHPAQYTNPLTKYVHPVLMHPGRMLPPGLGGGGRHTHPARRRGTGTG